MKRFAGRKAGTRGRRCDDACMQRHWVPAQLQGAYVMDKNEFAVARPVKKKMSQNLVGSKMQKCSP